MRLADRRVLVVGLGSMGKRRIRNLQQLGISNIVGFDPRADRREEANTRYGVEVATHLDAALSKVPDLTVVSTPPDTHVSVARRAIEAGSNAFMEASVVSTGLVELNDLARSRGRKAFPSCTMRFNPSVKRMRELIQAGAIGRPLAFTHHSGQYLPDWHPWEDYRTFYVARRETGACREIVPFELVWIVWILGPIVRITAMRGKLSDLDVDIDDVYQLLTSHANGVLGHLLVDVIARTPIRELRVLGTEGVILWNGPARLVRVERPSRDPEVFEEAVGTIESGYIHAEEPYVEEMRALLAALDGEGQFPHDIESDLVILECLEAAERAGDTSRILAHSTRGSWT